VDIRQAFEESLEELGITNLDETPEDTPDGTAEKTEEAEAGGADEAAEEAGTPDSDEDASETEDEVEDPDGLPVFEITNKSRLKLPDGTIVDADKAVLMQADYTRKTQELAEQRKKFESEQEEFKKQSEEVNGLYQQMTDWYQERANNPSAWIMEIAASTEDPTVAMAQALNDLAKNGMLDSQFVETFGIEVGEVAEIAERGQVTDEINELKRWKQEQEQERQREAAIRQQQAKYEQEWASIKSNQGLNFSDKADEMNAKRELLQFAIDNNLGRSLIDAYDLMVVRKGRVAPKQEKEPTPDPELVAKKRASRAVTPRTDVSGSTAKRTKPLSDREAILEAMEDLARA
jgi:hypothetical protein